jgi:hypothetical protein
MPTTTPLSSRKLPGQNGTSESLRTLEKGKKNVPQHERIDSAHELEPSEASIRIQRRVQHGLDCVDKVVFQKWFAQKFLFLLSFSINGIYEII